MGSILTGFPSLSTFPITAYVFGAAISVVPISMLMEKRGRRIGFVVAALSGLFGGVSIMYAWVYSSFVVLCIGGIFVGVLTASAGFLRFAALESSPERLHGRAASIVLSGGIIAAIFGPQLPARVADVLRTDIYYSLGIALIICFIVKFHSSAPTEDNGSKDRRGAIVRLFDLFGRPNFARGVIACAGGYGLMTLLMNASPLIMTTIYRYPMQMTEQVMTYHFLCMFVPFLVSGVLLDKIGVTRLIYTGLFFYLLSIVWISASSSISSFSASLSFLGIGWNFLYLGGTTLLFRSLKAEDSHLGQRTNELFVDGINLVASFSVGFLLFRFGWESIQTTSAISLLVVAFVFILMGRKKGAL